MTLDEMERLVFHAKMNCREVRAFLAGADRNEEAGEIAEAESALSRVHDRLFSAMMAARRAAHPSPAPGTPTKGGQP